MTLDPKERAAQAKDYFMQGYNCAQAVLLAFADITAQDPKVLATIATGFGGGVGHMRQICGTVSGMAMVAGFLIPYTDTTQRNVKAENYAFVQKLADDFKELNGSIVCGELLGGRNDVSAPPQERTPQYYKKRPCAELVAIAAEILANRINELGR